MRKRRKSLTDALLAPLLPAILPTLPSWLMPTFAGIVVAIVCGIAWSVLN